MQQFHELRLPADRTHPQDAHDRVPSLVLGVQVRGPGVAASSSE
jgi:hypothetical protein